MNLNFNQSFRSCCTWLFFGLFLLGLSPDAIANTLTIKNEGDCAVNIYHWIPSGDVYQTTLQSGHDFQINSSEGEKYRAVDTDNVWNNLIFDQHYMLNGNANQTWTINPNYCTGASNGCDGQITQFQLNRQDGSALLNLTEGATFCESDFTKDVKIRALVGGSHKSLKFTIITPNGTQTKTENHLTYDSGQFWLSPGDYTVKAELFSHANLTGDICDTKMLSFTVNDCNAVTIPTLTCDSDFEITNTVRLVYSRETISSFDLPAVFNNADFVKIPEVIASDSYDGRESRNQANEQLKLVFLRNGNVTGQSEYTPDLQDGVETAFYQGTLPDVNLNGGADQVLVIHPGDPTYGDNITNSPNSLDLSGLCLMAGNVVVVDPCANGGAPVATVVKNDPNCGNNDGKFTFSFDDRAGRTNIEFSIDGGNTYPHNVSDNVGSTMISNLGNGSYDLYVRWGK